MTATTLQLRSFYVGYHQPSDAAKIKRPLCFSVMRLRRRVSWFADEFILDSGGYNEITKHGHYRMSAEEYGSTVNDLRRMGGMVWAAQQDFMCEPEATSRTGLTVRDHQQLSTARLIYNLKFTDVIPVVQGRSLADYEIHASELRRLGRFPVVGVGSVCCRKKTAEINDIYDVVKNVFWDATLHGFGVKTQTKFESSDSMAWSIHERKTGGNPNSWVAAQKYYDKTVSKITS